MKSACASSIALVSVTSPPASVPNSSAPSVRESVRSPSPVPEPLRMFHEKPPESVHSPSALAPSMRHDLRAVEQLLPLDDLSGDVDA